MRHINNFYCHTHIFFFFLYTSAVTLYYYDDTKEVKIQNTKEKVKYKQFFKTQFVFLKKKEEFDIETAYHHV